MKFCSVPGIGELDEGPAPEAAVVVDGGHPQVRAVATFAALSFFFSPVTSTIRLSRSSCPMAVVDAGDEVGDVVALLAVERVGDGEAEVVVLHVADDLVHVLQRLGHLLLPGLGVGDHVGDVALVGAVA